MPRLKAVQQLYRQQKAADVATPFPYWAQIWPAALALGTYLVQNPQTVKGKNVLEIAAGLGLPSLVAARFASSVTCTDYIAAAVHAAQQSAQHNGLINMHCQQLDWYHLPQHIHADVLLLSDVNYEPQAFEVLYQLLQTFLQKGSTVLLSTPQRLMAKPFISRLLPWCVAQQQVEVPMAQQAVPVSVMVLSQP